MNDPLENPQELSVQDLFTSGQYIIPIYQRNYAWGKDEIEQLLQDLMDVAKLNKENNYYLGSLVVHQREGGRFEIIDGQQRHTTLCILMAVLKNEFSTKIAKEIDTIKINLEFEHRALSSETLNSLFNKGLSEHHKSVTETTMVAAYKMMKNYLNKLDNQEVGIDCFANYLTKNTKVLRVIVPEDTNLNHYFEIMNSRGEQLEKHEILKARLMEALKKEEQATFAKIWDACADMSRYVQLGFSKTERAAIFGKDCNTCSQDFSVLANPILEIADGDVKTLTEILNNPKYKAKKDGGIEEGKYGSVINFPNFLLQVLLVLNRDNDKLALDDKRLLDFFDLFKSQNNKFEADFTKTFIMALLRMRLLFDNWIIKTTSDADHWSLKTIKQSTDKTSGYSLNNSAIDASMNQQLIMALSMFHVSFPSQNYKHWLSAALNYLYHKSLEVDGFDAIESGNYLRFLECLSDKFFYGRFGADTEDMAAIPKEYHDLVFGEHNLTGRVIGNNVLNEGAGVHHFIFNRLDYLLWKRIVIAANEPAIDITKNIENIKKLASAFKFTFRSSIEHYYPQTPEGNVPKMEVATCNRFGNLCLISHGNNSSYSNFLPEAKKQRLTAKSANESLKQIIMMSYENWGPSDKGLANIQAHEGAMIMLLGSKVE